MIIILVEPQLGENIGAVARVMKNFALDELRIIKPRDGWPNHKAQIMSVGAADIIAQAKIYADLAAAIADIQNLYAMSARLRDLNKEFVTMKGFFADYDIAAKNAVLFGRENNGLTNEEISYARKVIQINSSDFSSLNLAQAVGIFCHNYYENFNQKDDIIKNNDSLATNTELENFFSHLTNELDNKQFFRVAAQKPSMLKNIRNIFTKINLSSQEVRTLRGIIASLTSR